MPLWAAVYKNLIPKSCLGDPDFFWGWYADKKWDF